MSKQTWTEPDLHRIYELRKRGKNWKEIGKELNRSENAIIRKYTRTDWNEFNKDPEVFIKLSPRKWAREEMIQLDAFIQSDKSYDFIAERLGRTITSVERQAQTTDWKAWRALSLNQGKDGEEGEKKDDKDDEKIVENLINAILTVARNDLGRLAKIDKDDFLQKVNLDESRMSISFDELRKKAEEELDRLGYKNPETIQLQKGTYIIVGDSHGKHTRKGMFALLEQINKHIKPDKIIHIGHILDDDNDISYDWGRFSNLIILAKIEELRKIQDQRNRFKFNYEVVRDIIELGDMLVVNQDIISDYVKTPISSLDERVFDENVIVNCHRHELCTRTSYRDVSYLASPGCLCEDHIIRTIKQMDFADGTSVKQAFWEGFSKYRRQKHMNKFWEQGLLVVNVNEKGRHTLVPCRIRETSRGYTTSYFDKMITSKGVCNPDNKIFVNGDMHCDMHEIKVLDIQEQICRDYKPDTHVNLGDTYNCSSLNHHLMDRGIPILQEILDESATTYYALKRLRLWAKESHLIFGNHERFAEDFIAKYPQFRGYVDFRFICSVDDLGYKLTDLKQVLKIGSGKFIHGEIKMFGQSGSMLEKAAKTFGENVFVGHMHYPAIRSGCYSVGLSGKLDQHYNEPNASRWLHGFGLCNQFENKTWMSTISIIKNEVMLGKKIYMPRNLSSWKTPKYRARIVYDTEEGN